DGNGNVILLSDTATGALTAKYEYTPFGRLIRATGPIATTNPIRFSTKYQDDESGFNYYGNRFYNPDTGRWLNRDPVAELGAMVARFDAAMVERHDVEGTLEIVLPNSDPLGMYQFVSNVPLGQIDLLGMVGLLPGCCPGRPYNPSCNPFSGSVPNPWKGPDPSNCSKVVCNTCCGIAGGTAKKYCSKIKNFHAQAVCEAIVYGAVAACVTDCQKCPNP
ncbi:MAG: RHS repeat-associated core domain-containing protein, partial [Alphaproteobacteria bacterium]